MADDEKSKNQILQALVALSHTLFHQAQGAACRTSSLALRSADGDNYASRADAVPAEAPRWLSRHLSLMSQSRWRSKQKNHGKDDDEDDDQDTDDGDAALLKCKSFAAVSHIDMQRVCCLFSVEVVAAQCLPPSMNGLLLEVAVRRKETRDGAVCTMPARVQKGAADFDETLYVRCHLYCRGGGGTGKPLKFEPLPFLLSVVSIDAPELDLGQSSMDLSAFVKEFTDKYQQRVCPRQWDATFPLAGKAKGGNLVIRLAFQIMEGLGLIVNSQPVSVEKATNSSWSSSFAPKISKSSFIVMSPKMLRSKLSFPPKMPVSTPNLMDIEKSMLDELTPAVEVKAAALAEQKVPQHKPEEVKVVKEEVQQKELELEESKEEEDQKDSDPEPKPEDEKYDDLELPNFYLEDKGLKGKEEAEAEKTLEATVLGAMSGMAANSVEHPGTNCEEVIGESQKPLEANWEEVTGESLQLPEANGEEVTRVSLLLSEVNVEEVTKVSLLTNIDNFKLEELAPAPEVKAAAQAEQKGSEHKLEEVKEEQLKETAEPEPIVVGEEEERQKESDHEPEAKDEKFDDLDLLESEAVVKGIEGQEVAEAEKALEAIVFNTMSDTVIELVEKWEANCEEVTGASQHPLEANGEEVTQESLQLPEANEEEVTRVSLLLSKANGEEVTRESLQPPEANMKEVTVESLQLPEANGEEVMGESLQPSETNGEEVTRGSLQLPDANWEEETGESLQPPEANMQEVAEEFLQPLEVNEKEVTGECLHPPEQGEVKAAAVKSPLRRIRWRTLATIITPVAVFVGKALARRKQWMNLTLELRCHVVSHPNQSPHHHYVQHLLHCDLQCSVPSHQILSPIQ